MREPAEQGPGALSTVVMFLAARLLTVVKDSPNRRAAVRAVRVMLFSVRWSRVKVMSTPVPKSDFF